VEDFCVAEREKMQALDKKIYGTLPFWNCLTLFKLNNLINKSLFSHLLPPLLLERFHLLLALFGFFPFALFLPLFFYFGQIFIVFVC
jgi:hypothetical protein